MWHYLEDFAICWHFTERGDFFNPGNVLANDFMIETTDSNHAVSLGAQNMRTVNTHRSGVHLIATHALSLTQCVINRLSWAGQIDDSSLAHAAIWRLANTYNSWCACGGVNVAYDTANSGRTDVYTDSISRSFLHVF